MYDHSESDIAHVYKVIETFNWSTATGNSEAWSCWLSGLCDTEQEYVALLT